MHSVKPSGQRLPILLRAGLCLALAAGWTGTLQAQDKFRSRNYRVRIAVAHQVQRLMLQPSGTYQVVDSEGRPLLQVNRGRQYFVQITQGQPGGRTYRLVLHEMPPHQVNAAIERARQARQTYKLPVKVLRIPARSREEERILVTLGQYESAQAARSAVQGFPDEQIDYIYEERDRAEHGQVRLLDREGVVLARDGRYLRMVPLDMAGDVLGVRSPNGNPGRIRRYRGEIELTINEEGTLTAVNDLWVEYYLYSVVAGEIGGSAPIEALKAQAVAARSESVAKIERGIVSGSFFDFYDTALAQIYRGIGDETAKSRRAVDATRGEILVWHGHAVDAVYSHSCGGVLSSSRQIWDGINEGYATSQFDRLDDDRTPQLTDWAHTHPYTSKPIEALCHPNQPGFPAYAKKYFRWRRTLSARKLTNIIDPLHGTGRVRNVLVEDRAASGRVRKLAIQGERRTVVIDRQLKIRKALGGIYSTLFTFIKQKDPAGDLRELTIFGAGYGHGVGMCQMGAYMMGVRGYNYRQILAHYYNNVKMRRLYQ